MGSMGYTYNCESCPGVTFRVLYDGSVGEYFVTHQWKKIIVLTFRDKCFEWVGFKYISY